MLLKNDDKDMKEYFDIHSNLIELPLYIKYKKDMFWTSYKYLHKTNHSLKNLYKNVIINPLYKLFICEQKEVYNQKMFYKTKQMNLFKESKIPTRDRYMLKDEDFNDMFIEEIDEEINETKDSSYYDDDSYYNESKYDDESKE
jgi:hypothetical protein